MKMKKGKRVLCLLLAAMLCCGSLVVTGSDTAQAASVAVPKHVRCGVGERYSSSFRVDFASPQDTIKNIKVYKGKSKTKDLVAKVTSLAKYSYNPYAYITYYAKAAGTYKIKFDVYKSKKSKRTSKTVTVHAEGTGSTISSVTVDGKNVLENGYYTSSYYTTKKSGKVKFKLANGYKIKKITAYYYDKKGNEKSKTFKNGKKINFSKYTYNYSYDSNYWSSPMWAQTRFEIEYTDKYNKGYSSWTSFYVYKKR